MIERPTDEEDLDLRFMEEKKKDTEVEEKSDQEDNVEEKSNKFQSISGLFSCSSFVINSELDVTQRANMKNQRVFFFVFQDP